jgi:hypothetical protein
VSNNSLHALGQISRLLNLGISGLTLDVTGNPFTQAESHTLIDDIMSLGGGDTSGSTYIINMTGLNIAQLDKDAIDTFVATHTSSSWTWSY